MSSIDSFGLLSFRFPKSAVALLVSTSICFLSFSSKATGCLLSIISIFGWIFPLVCSVITCLVISA